MSSNSNYPHAARPFEAVRATRAGRFFWIVTAHPWLVVLVSLLGIVGIAAFIPSLTRDTRAEAFIRSDHPAVVQRDRVEAIFGLKDPIIIAVVNEGPQGVFNPETLELVAWLTDEAMKVENVDPERVTSLYTENDIFGTDFGMEVDPFYEYPPETQEEADTIRENVMDFPLYVESLVAEDGTATLIIAELLGELESGAGNYQAFLDLAARAPTDNGETIHVAGEGAVAEYLGAYIDRDASRLNPVSALVITLVIFVAFRTFSGVFLPNLVVLGAMAFTLGSMAAAGVPFYVITNSLPVIVLAVSVADGIHILSTYYEELAAHPDENARQLTVRAMVHMWRPVTFTSLTDMAGFMGLSLASFMPPMRWFGVFASVGVIAALLFSVLTIPAAMVLLNPRQSGPFRRLAQPGGTGDAFSRVMGAWGGWVAARPTLVVVTTVTITVLGAIGATRLVVNEERMSVFRETEPIHIADREINARLSGTSYLDIVVEAQEKEGLFNPTYLQRVEAMQKYVESLPHVTTSTSIVDYMKQMNRAFNEDQQALYTLPEDPELVAQYFLLYSATGDPSDFEEEIDYDYRLANVRVAMDSGQYQNLKPVVTSMEAYIRDEFNTDGLKAYLAGRVNVDYHWIKDLAPSHFRGVGLALVAVFLMASLSFRSFAAGFLATIPVCLALLAIYAVMGFFGIWLGIGTTMFAAIGIGVSVDFAIHTVDRLIALVRDERRDLDEALAMLYPSTGRALLFSFAAMALGFSVLLISEVPPLNRFGALVALAVSISFITSMTVLPALVKLTRPRFLEISAPRDSSAIGEITPELAE